ncbi:MAG: HAD family hydrolase [Candidatus Bipolaricaulis sp.]
MSVHFVVSGRPCSASGFLFDKDGTLLTFDHWRAVMAERARRIAAALGLTELEHAALRRFMGLDPARPEDATGGLIPVPRADAEEATALYLAGDGKGERAEMRSLVARAFREVDEAFPFERYLRPTPGAEEVLRAIRRAGGRTAIVTHDAGAAAQHHLAALGWAELLDAVIGLEMCTERKPSPGPLLAACRALRLAPGETVMVGDTASDLAAGRAAGCQLTVGVLTGLGKEVDLAPVADAVLPDLTAVEFL